MKVNDVKLKNWTRMELLLQETKKDVRDIFDKMTIDTRP